MIILGIVIVLLLVCIIIFAAVKKSKAKKEVPKVDPEESLPKLKFDDK